MNEVLTQLSITIFIRFFNSINRAGMHVSAGGRKTFCHCEGALAQCVIASEAEGVAKQSDSEGVVLNERKRVKDLMDPSSLRSSGRRFASDCFVVSLLAMTQSTLRPQ